MVPRPKSPTQTHIADEATSTCVDVRYRGAATTVYFLVRSRKQGSGNIDKTLTMPQDSPLPRVNKLGSDEGNMTLQELMLIKKVKKLENKVKSNQARRRARIVVSNDEEDLEDPSKQGRKISEIDQDPTISLVQHDAEIQGRQEHDMEFEFDLDAAKDVSTAEEDISTAKPVSTAGAAVTTASVDVSTVTVSTAKDKGKRVEVGDKVMLEVSPWKDVLHFRKKDLLAPRYYWTNANLHVHVEEIKVDKTLRLAEEHVEIIDRQVKSLKRSRIPIVKSIRT
ncbi:hypothetical protein Tco_1212506 [Tanacetum coccineum]